MVDGAFLLDPAGQCTLGKWAPGNGHSARPEDPQILGCSRLLPDATLPAWNTTLLESSVKEKKATQSISHRWMQPEDQTVLWFLKMRPVTNFVSTVL